MIYISDKQKNSNDYFKEKPYKTNQSLNLSKYNEIFFQTVNLSQIYILNLKYYRTLLFCN